MANLKSRTEGAQKKAPAPRVIPGGYVPREPPHEALQVRFSHGRCKACNSPHRDQIEFLTKCGISYQSICDLFNQDGVSNFTYRNLSLHHKKHMDVLSAATRTMLEKRARDIFLDLENTTGYITTQHGMLEVMLQDAWHQIIERRMEFKPADVLSIMAAKKRIEDVGREESIDVIMHEAEMFASAVKAVVPPADWEKIVEQFDRNMKLSPPKVIAQAKAEESINEEQWLTDGEPKEEDVEFHTNT